MATRRTRGHVLRCLVVLVASTALAACGAGDGGGPDDEATAGGSSSGSDETSTGTEPNGTETGNGTATGSTTTAAERNIIAWILGLGAGSPPGPANDYLLAYDALKEQDCERALTEAQTPQVQSVIEAAAMACLAARGGDDALWDEAAGRRDELAGADLSCLDTAAYSLLDQLLRAHEEAPDLTFEFHGGQGAGEPPCPADVGLEPDRGEAGDAVTLTGTNLQFVDGVIVAFREGEVECSDAEFDDLVECYEVDGDGSPGFTAPAPPDGVTSARVIVLAAPAQWQMAEVTFEYVDPATGTPTSTEPPDATHTTDATGTTDTTSDGESTDAPSDPGSTGQP